MKKLISFFVNYYEKRKNCRIIISLLFNQILDERRQFETTVEILHQNHFRFSQNIQNGEREINIDLPFAKAKLIWNENGKNLIYYTINIY